MSIDKQKTKIRTFFVVKIKVRVKRCVEFSIFTSPMTMAEEFVFFVVKKGIGIKKRQRQFFAYVLIVSNCLTNMMFIFLCDNTIHILISIVIICVH